MNIGIVGQGFVGTAIREGLNNFYNISHRGSKGFYVIDGVKFDKVLKNIKDKDSVIRKKTLNHLKNNYPILCQQRKTRRLILEPLEKNLIWDVSLFHQWIKSLCDESVLCSTDTFGSPIVNNYYTDALLSLIHI